MLTFAHVERHTNIIRYIIMTRQDISVLGREDVFKTIGSEWMLITATCGERVNTMTASWGGMGWLWNKPVAFLFVRPERFTHEFIESGERLTLSFFTPGHKAALSLCGTRSGRDGDKIAAAGLTPQSLDSGAVTFAQARLTLDCRKLFKTEMTETAFLDREVLARWYNANPGGGLHTIYIVEIEGVYTA